MIRRHIPNFITLLNLFSGCIAIVLAFHGELQVASVFVIVAAIFDFLDGMAARLLKVKSDLGIQLDSLADMVSFGLVPGIMVLQLMELSPDKPHADWFVLNPFLLIAFLIPVFSALRLANFNIDTRQTESFIGLPTPANALFFISLPFVIQQSKEMAWNSLLGVVQSYWFLTGIVIVFSFLMVSEIRLLSMKFKGYRWKLNANRYILILFAITCVVFLKFVAIPLIIIFYILFSMFVSNKSETMR